MRRVLHSLEEEQLLWAQEVERSKQDYERAVREGIIPDTRSMGRSASHEALQVQCHDLIRRSRAICNEARSLRDSSRLLRR